MLVDIWLELIKDKKKTFIHRGDRFIIYGLKKVKNELFYFRIAKENESTEYKEGDKDVIKESDKKLAVVNFVVHSKTQSILCQRDTNAFAKTETPMNALRKYLCNLTIINDYVVSIDEKPSKKQFWDHLESATGVYLISFKLNSLNLELGGKNIRNAINAINDDFNNEELDITLRNRKGKLTLAKEKIEDYIEYIHTLGGKYKMVYKSSISRRKKAVTSLQNIISFKFSKDITEDNSEDIIDKLNEINDKTDE